MEKLGIPIGVGVVEKEPMISFRVDAGLAETFSDHVENVLWKVSLGGKCGLGLQAVGNIAQLRSDEIQRLNTLVRLDDVGASTECGGDHGEL